MVLGVSSSFGRMLFPLCAERQTGISTAHGTIKHFLVFFGAVDYFSPKNKLLCLIPWRGYAAIQLATVSFQRR